jgi:integrase
MHCYLKERKGNGIWYIWEYDDATGQCSKLSTRTRDRSQAEQELAKYILSKPTRQPMHDPTIVQIMLRYWQLYGKDCFGAGTVKLVMGKVANQIPEMRLSQFTPVEQEKFVAGLAPATGKRYLGQIHAAINWMHRRDEVSFVPTKFRVVGHDRPGASPLKIDDLRKLCAAAKSTRQRLFLAIAIATAQRPAHILELTWDRVNFEIGVIDFQDPARKRTKKVRPTVPMSPALQSFLIEHRSIGPVLQRHGRRLSGHRTMFRRLCNAAGVSGSAYGIRKAVATYMRRQGIPEMDLKGMLGHRLGGNTDRYAHLDPQFMLAAKAASQSLLREVAPFWLSRFFPAEQNEMRNLLIVGAGNEARTRDLNLGKVGILHSFQLLKPANDD